MATSIATELRIRIAEGKLRNGDQLQPTGELAAAFGVSRPTMRECLRILEGEGLVDLRAGARNGARVREPTTETAAQLAGTILEAGQTRMADVADARALIEPEVMHLVAARVDSESLRRLSEKLEELKGIVDEPQEFMESFKDLEREAFVAAHNPAISIAVEIIHWVNIRCRRALFVSALGLPQVLATSGRPSEATDFNRRACRAFEAFLDETERNDPVAAKEVWAQHLESLAPFFHSSVGDRLIVELFD
jgi:DNA-binding FadR family transcriptional regulator